MTTSTLADGFTSGGHNGAPFSTSDRNNAGSCATDFFSGMNITSVLDENYITKDIILQLNTRSIIYALSCGPLTQDGGSAIAVSSI